MPRLPPLRLLPLSLLLACATTGGDAPGQVDNGPEITPEYCESRGLVFTTEQPVCGPTDEFLGTEAACVPACDTGRDCMDGALIFGCG